MKIPRHIVVIGTSAGGLKALSELVRHLNKKMDAAFFIVMHLSATSITEFLVNRLQVLTDLTCVTAEDNMAIQKGFIYIAAPDKHLLVKKDSIVIGHGPKEGNWRPSINVMFRSAAAAYGSAVTGIILTGLLNDGNTGMNAIKKCGGNCIVQDPNEAEYPDMPLAVLNDIEVDYCIPLAEMGKVLEKITVQEPPQKEIPPEIIIESEIAEKMIVSYDNIQQLGEKSIFACPDCGGGLFEIKEANKMRYRCHIGHAYSEEELTNKQSGLLETTLWVALRVMEEKRTLLQRMEFRNSAQGLTRTALEYKKRVIEIQEHIDKLKQVLFSSQDMNAA